MKNNSSYLNSFLTNKVIDVKDISTEDFCKLQITYDYNGKQNVKDVNGKMFETGIALNSALINLLKNFKMNSLTFQI